MNCCYNKSDVSKPILLTTQVRSQWFLNILLDHALAASWAAMALFGGIFKNQLLRWYIGLNNKIMVYDLYVFKNNII